MNIILIGMPGAGKSTIGPALAVELGLEFIDTDTLLKEKLERELSDIVVSDGYEVFLRLQEEMITSKKLEGVIIATGGSVVCSDPAMLHLKKDGSIIYLKMNLEDIEKRLSPERKLARSKNRSLADVFNERCPLYEKHANLIVNCTGKNINTVVMEILLFLKQKK